MRRVASYELRISNSDKHSRLEIPMRLLTLFALFAVLLLAIGCGGGSGGGNPNPGTTVRLSGRVLNVVTGGIVTPVPTVRVGTATTTASDFDGSFDFDVPKGATTVTVETTDFGTWTFTVPALNADTELGDLWVGPNRVTVTGTVRDSSNDAPVSGVAVNFGGRRGTTNASGVFTLTEVAYANAAPEGIANIQGTATAEGYIPGVFSAETTASGGGVNIGDVILTPSGDENPPPGPYNIWGKVLPEAQAVGTTVTLSQGGVATRTYTVGNDGRYYFWVSAGTYTVRAVKGDLASDTVTVTLPASNQVVRKDVTLR